MDPHFPASSALPPHLRPALGEARLRAHWPGDGVVRALGVREPMPRGLVRRPGGTGDIFLACFHQPVLVRLTAGRVRVPANTLVAWLPGMAQEYGLEDAAWIHSWLHLRGPLAESLIACAGLPTGVAIPLPAPEFLETPAIDLHAEMARRPADTAVVEALALILLRRLARLAPRETDGLGEAHRRIVERPQERPRLADLAELAGCSQQHLCRIFRARYGITPVALAARLRLERAAQLLSGGMAPAAAAAEGGWADTRQFSRVFRDCFGKTPAAWAAR